MEQQDCFNIIARLPFGHVFGMAYDFLYTIFNGAHIHFLTQIIGETPLNREIETVVPGNQPELL